MSATSLLCDLREAEVRAALIQVESGFISAFAGLTKLRTLAAVEREALAALESALEAAHEAFWAVRGQPIIPRELGGENDS